MTARPKSRTFRPGPRGYLTRMLDAIAVATGSAWLLPWPVWATAAAVQILEPIPFLARDGVSAQRLARYPLLVLVAALWLPIRFLSRRANDWYHTPHDSENKTL